MKMLLTSSQVAVLLTCGMVLLCTSALFISGCLIQQRTLRDLRTAIRPTVVTRPKPRSWDTEALRRRHSQQQSTVKLADGTRVQIQQHDDDVDLTVAASNYDNDKNENGYVDIEVRPSTAAVEVEGEKESKSKGSWDGIQEGGEPISRAERRRRIKAEIERLSKGNTPVYYQRRLW
ncbi:hypothetical protein F5Y17DRAFT_189533 [Xylariaceae sp. FL0594]|nr:hypothetical protein F5Y17DRAFT_189533 [Xylariaceae sp. FL0594]